MTDQKIESFDLLIRLANEGDRESMVKLGRLYLQKEYYDKNKSKKWLKKSIDCGALWARHDYADAILDNETQNALSIYSELANEGDSVAMVKLGRFYYSANNHLTRNINKTIKWLKLGYENGATWICKELILRLLERSLPEDLKYAYEIVSTSASETTDEFYHKLLVKMYWNGEGVNKNRKHAKKLMKQYDCYRRSFPIKPFHYFNEKIFLFDNIILIADSDDLLNKYLICACLQNNIELFGYVNMEVCKNFSYHIDQIDVCDLKHLDNYAIITTKDNVEKYSKYFQECVFFTEFDESFDNDKVFPLYSRNDEIKNTDQIIMVGCENEIGEPVDKKSTHKYMTYSEIKNLSEEDKQNFKFIVSSYDFIKAKRNLTSFGVSISSIFVNYILLNKKTNIVNETNCIHYDKITEGYFVGEKIYNTLSSGYFFYLLSSRDGMGDEYKQLTRLSSYKKYNQKNTKVIVSEKSKDLLDLFSYEGIVLSNEHIASLRMYIRITQKFDSSILLIGDWTGINRCTPPLDPVSGRPANDSPSWIEHPLKIPPCTIYDSINYPNYPVSINKNEILNSVLINPYAKFLYGSRPHLKKIFIEILSEVSLRLSNLGYKVYTNTPDLKNQPPLIHTNPLCVSIRDLVAICRDFKYIVSVRTGFADVLILTDCNLGVITDDSFDILEPIAYLNNRPNYNGYKWKDNKKELINKIMEDILVSIPPANTDSTN